MLQKWNACYVKFPGSRARSTTLASLASSLHNTSSLAPYSWGLLTEHQSPRALPRCSHRWSRLSPTNALSLALIYLLTKLTTIHPFVSSTPGQYGVCLRPCYLPWHDNLDFGRPFSPRLATWCISLPCASLLHCRILVMDKISTGTDALGRSKHCSQPCYM